MFNGRSALRPHAQVGEEHLNIANTYNMGEAHSFLGGPPELLPTMLAHAMFKFSYLEKVCKSFLFKCS